MQENVDEQIEQVKEVKPETVATITEILEGRSGVDLNLSVFTRVRAQFTKMDEPDNTSIDAISALIENTKLLRETPDDADLQKTQRRLEKKVMKRIGDYEVVNPGRLSLLNVCLCGCGGLTKNKFMQGHDMRLKGLLKKIAKSCSEDEKVANRYKEFTIDMVPEVARPELRELLVRWDIDIPADLVNQVA